MTKILELYHSVLLNVFFYSEDQIPESNKIAFLNFSQLLLCSSSSCCYLILLAWLMESKIVYSCHCPIVVSFFFHSSHYCSILPPSKLKVFLSVGPCLGNSAIYHSNDFNLFFKKKKSQVPAPRFEPKISGW